MDYGLWADVVGVIHGLVVLFVVGGQALILAGWAAHWTWTRARVFRFAHLAAIGFIVAVVLVEIWRPLLVALAVVGGLWASIIWLRSSKE